MKNAIGVDMRTGKLPDYSKEMEQELGSRIMGWVRNLRRPGRYFVTRVSYGGEDFEVQVHPIIEREVEP